MSNLFRELIELLPAPQLQVGTIISNADGVCTLELPGGGIAQARGSAPVGSLAFFCDGAIQGEAIDLPLVEIEI